MPQLDITSALGFLDTLDPNGRHTIASEAPFGGRDRGPKWEGGATYEASQRSLLISDIEARQARGSNVYYSVNCPCPVQDRVGANGKNNADDIIALRALAFDIDLFTNVELVNARLSDALKPSLIINTGGGLHLIYLLNKFINVDLYRSPSNDAQEQSNLSKINVRNFITRLAHDFEALLRSLFPMLKIDSMSNIDRVMRLPGTVNYPKAEKIANGQVEALAHIAIDNHVRCDPRQLRSHVPELAPARKPSQKFQAPKDDQWPAYRKALTLCEFIRDNGLADSNETYTHWVMLPLIGMVHDLDENNRITLDEAEECFLEAVSGGVRYGTVGRGIALFKRQWRSHKPELARQGTRSIGSLVKFCQEHGMQLPWSSAVVKWEAEIYCWL
jgi:hypothetical protein